jgi:hypothetical protein
MSTATLRLEAGGLVPVKTKVDGEATEQIVARSYHHHALGDRPVVRLASDRLGEAEDLAMEFLGFAKPVVSAPLAIQQRQSLGFAAWALINDPGNARYALDLVKRMKQAARKAKAKPGHAWDDFTAMSKELGKSAAHFLPPYWEEVGRTFKELGNFTYAGRALTRSMEAERVHALESDRARRRDVVLEFVLAGCLTGKALSDYASDLLNQYSSAEAFQIFRDLCVRRTLGGMAPWAAMPKDFIKVAKAAELDGDAEFESWLEEVIETPAMGRVANQFWKTCKKNVQRVVDRSPAFAVALLRHTRPEATYYDDKTLPWLQLLQDWGVFEYLWEDEHNGAPPLGEPIAEWFGRVLRFEQPAPVMILEMLKNVEARLKDEGAAVQLSCKQRYRADVIDVDVLETCLARGIVIDDPPEEVTVSFDGWLLDSPDHEFRNCDLVHCGQDDRYKPAVLTALTDALSCRGGMHSRGWRQADVPQRPFPEAAAARPGIIALWREHFADVLKNLDGCGLASFRIAVQRLEQTFWPESLKLFPDLAEQLRQIDPAEMLRRTLGAGVFAEYGWPEIEEALAKHKIKIKHQRYGRSNFDLVFPDLVVKNGTKAVAIGPKGVRTWELQLPKKAELEALFPIGDDLGIEYQDNSTYDRLMIWASDPKTKHKADYRYHYGSVPQATDLADGSVFLGSRSVRAGDKKLPETKDYFHDGERFWRVENEYVGGDEGYRTSLEEVDPQTGKKVRSSVPKFFEEAAGGKTQYDAAELFAAPTGLSDSPLGIANGLCGWKAIKRRDGSFVGEGIDGRKWDQPLITPQGEPACPVALLPQPGTDEYLPITSSGGRARNYWVWDATGSTVVEIVEDLDPDDDEGGGRAFVLPLRYWHLLKLRDEASSKKLRKITLQQAAELMQAAEVQPASGKTSRRKKKKDDGGSAALAQVLPVVAKLLPKAPEAMQAGVAHVVQQAAEQAARFLTMRDSTTDQAAANKSSVTGTRDPQVDIAAEAWNLERYDSYGSEPSLSANLAAAAEFLQGDASEADLPEVDKHWFSLLGAVSLHAWKAMWKAASDKLSSKGKSSGQFVEVLEWMLELGLFDLPGEFAEMAGRPQDAKKSQYGGYDVETDTGTSYAFRQGDDAFIVIENDSYDDDPFSILRYSTGKSPGTPADYKVKGVKKLRLDWTSDQIREFIAAAKASEELPLPTPQELATTATKLNASTAEIGLIWLAGLNMNSYESNFLPAEIRKSLGLKVTDVSAAKQSLSNLKDSVREQLFAAVLSKGPAAAFADDRGPVLAAIEKTWQSKLPKRLAIDAAIQKRLSAFARQHRWQTIDHEELLAAAAEPAKAAALQPRAMEIKQVKTRYSVDLAISGGNKYDFDASILLSAAQLIGLVHSDCPGGTPARAEMPALVQQINKLLSDKRTLLPLRHLAFYDYGSGKKIKPIEWLEKHVGKTKADKQKVARLDEGLVAAAATVDGHEVVVAFRPAKLKDAADLTRLKGILAVEVSENYGEDGGLVPLALLLGSPGMTKLANAIASTDLPAEAWPQNPNLTAAKTVAAVAKHSKLSAEAATLYLQILALPDPTTANIRRWNDWKPAAIKQATAELLKANLVMEAKRARAGRSIFLPGEWAELKAPWLPIETWKHKHLCEFGFDVGTEWPVGGPMVFRPYDELFAAAWQRVIDGDVPKYEEVKRKRKK